MKGAGKARPRLTRQDWIEAALALLAKRGIGAVSVDRLATTLKVTRGSFYHHFSDRSDLLEAILEHWSQEWTCRIREQISELGLDASTTLLALMRAIRANHAAEYDAPIRAWALHDPIARRVVEEVDEIRMGFIRAQFVALGFEEVDAENRTRLLLYYEMAAPAVFPATSPEVCDKLLTERHRFLVRSFQD